MGIHRFYRMSGVLREQFAGFFGPPIHFCWHGAIDLIHVSNDCGRDVSIYFQGKNKDKAMDCTPSYICGISRGFHR